MILLLIAIQLVQNDIGQSAARIISSFTLCRNYRRALGALLVYDITKESTFGNLKSWLDNLKDHAEADICIMLVGNKLDLVKQDPTLREVDFDQANEFAKQENLMFIETSAVSDENVKDAFENLL